MLSISRFLDSASIAGFWEAEPLFCSGSEKKGDESMIGSTISHYKILEKLGEVPKLLPMFLIGSATLRISRCLDSVFAAGFQKAEPLFCSGSGKDRQ
jgi:hypothetical protein